MTDPSSMCTPVRYQVSKPVLVGRELEYVSDAVASGWISSTGPYLDRFEADFARLVGVDECTAVTNGTVGLHVACLAMGLKPGDEVIVPALTYVASANAIAYCGATPVFVDVDPATWNALPEAIEAAITPRTVGVMAVHLYGMPARVEQMAELCARRGLWLIEDCAESFGATIDGRFTGTYGDASVFSFYGNKTVSTGEGGAVFVRDPERRRHMKMLKGQGMDPERRYWHPIIGYNYRMTNMAAAIGVAQLECASFHLAERRRIATAYRVALGFLAANGDIRLPPPPSHSGGSYWLTALVLRDGGEARRSQMMAALARDGIETRPFFVPLHRLPMYAGEASFPVAEHLGDSGLNLPTYSGLSESDIEFICEQFVAAVMSSRR